MDLDVKCKAITFLEKKKEILRSSLRDLGLAKKLLELTPKVQFIKGKTDNLDFIKIKTFCSMEDPIKRMKRKAADREKIFASYIPNTRLVIRIYKEPSKPNCKKKNKRQLKIQLEKKEKERRKERKKEKIQLENGKKT